jgi:hypothetical protein
MGCAMRTKLEDIYIEGLEFEPSELKEFYKELRSIEKDWAKHKVDGHYHTEHTTNS